jgi:AraC-like DNA-binding protein
VREEITGKTSDVPFFSKTVVRDDATARRILRLHRALESSASPLERESLFLLAMMQLITRHADSKTGVQKTGREHAAVARVRDYFHANPCRNITLDELANIAFLSPFHLLRVFREETGLPPHAYQTQLRIEQAKRLLQDDFTIAQSALATGFFDQSHFSNQFKRYVGVTPGQFLSKN